MISYNSINLLQQMSFQVTATFSPLRISLFFINHFGQLLLIYFRKLKLALWICLFDGYTLCERFFNNFNEVLITRKYLEIYKVDQLSKVLSISLNQNYTLLFIFELNDNVLQVISFLLFDPFDYWINSAKNIDWLHKALFAIYGHEVELIMEGNEKALLNLSLLIEKHFFCIKVYLTCGGVDKILIIKPRCLNHA